MDHAADELAGRFWITSPASLASQSGPVTITPPRTFYEVPYQVDDCPRVDVGVEVEVRTKTGTLQTATGTAVVAAESLFAAL